MSVMTSRMCTGAGYNGAPRGGRFGGEMEGPVAPQRRYTLSENFYNVLADVGAEKDKQYEWKDVIMLFLRYLAKRKPSLFDPENKSRVMCQGDPLGRVFGVASFTKDETRMLVRQQISLVEDEALYASLPPLPGCSNSVPRPPGGADAERAKRGPTADADDPDSKRSRSEQQAAATAGDGSSEVPPPPPPAQLHRMDTIEASDDDEDDGVDAPLVAAMAAAAAARAGREDADDDRRTYARELEPVDGTDLAESDSDSSSGDSDFAESPLHLTMLTVWMDDVGMMADMETSESDTENQDTWMCSAPDCRHSNKARRSRCDKCWRTRPAWVVGPPRRRRRRRRERAGMTEAMRRSLAPKPASSAPAAAASTSSAAAATTSASEASDAKQESSADTGYGSQEAVLPSPPSPPPQPQPAVDQTCIICCEKNRDAAIIHGLTGCQVTCYQCARKLWKKKDLCPSCRRTIEKIVYMRFG